MAGLFALATAAVCLSQVLAANAQPASGTASSAPALKTPLDAASGNWAASSSAPASAAIAPRQSPAKNKLKPNYGRLNLVALLTDAGQQIDKGLVWRIYKPVLTGNAAPRIVHTDHIPAPLLELPAGTYIVNVAFGRANLTRKIELKPGDAALEQFVLNAGGLRVKAALADGTKIPADDATYDIFSDERNVFGNRTLVMSQVKPGIIIRLNAGIFYIVSTFGDANAKVSADITVEAGKLSEVLVTHSAARVTFKLVARTGGEAVAGTKWSLTTMKGVAVMKSVGAIPTHIVAAGSYIVSARLGNRVYRAQFTILPGQDADVEVVME